jgi:hypothetical protein
MNPFLPFLILSLVAACTWTVLVGAFPKRKRRVVGLLGAWAATAVLAALWQSAAVPWLGNLLQAMLLVWLGAIGSVVLAVVAIWQVEEPGRYPLMGCGVLSIVVNVAAGLLFLWEATVGVGGV